MHNYGISISLVSVSFLTTNTILLLGSGSQKQIYAELQNAKTTSSQTFKLQNKQRSLVKTLAHKHYSERDGSPRQGGIVGARQCGYSILENRRPNWIFMH